MTHDLLRLLAGCVRIAHHIPGRVRLKLDGPPGPELAQAAAAVESLRRTLEAAPGIRSVAVNPLAASCTITYDAAQIPPSAWPDLLRGEASPAAEPLRRILAAAAS